MEQLLIMLIRKHFFLTFQSYFSNLCIRFYLQHIITAFILYGLTGGLFSSCTEEEKRNPAQPGEMVVVEFTASKADYGIEGAEAGRPAGELRSGIPAEFDIAAYPLGEVKGSSTIRLSDEFFLSATLVEEPAPVTLRSIPLAWGSQVRIVAYSSGGTIYAGHADYKVVGDGTLTPVGLPMRVPAATYRFVAYSFLSGDPLDAFAETTALFKVSDDDLLWGYNDTAINTGNEAVHIIMNHLFSKVKLEVSSIDLTIDNITGAQISVFDSCRLVVRTGSPTPASGTMDVFPFVWSSTGSAKTWTSNEQLVYTGVASSGVEISSITIGGVVYPGPHVIPYSAPLVAGKSYTLRVRFLRPANFAPRITWEPASPQFPQGRYAITYNPADAGLYFKFGSVIGIYSGGGNTLTLTPPVASVPAFTTSSIPWNLKSAANWAAIASSNTNVNIDGTFHRGDTLKARGLGDPCRLVGLDLADIAHPNNFTPVVDFGAWRLPTEVENQIFSDTYDWQTATDILGEMFTPASASNSYFLPAAGYRTDNNGASTNVRGETPYWSSTSLSAGQGSALRFNSAILTKNSATAKQAALPIRCVYDPRVIFEAKPWEYEREYLDPISTTYQRQDSYLLDGSTYKIKIYGNTPWRIKSITQEDKSVATIFNANPFNGYDGQLAILALTGSDNLVVGTSGSGTFDGTEEVSFTVINDASFWGLVTVVFESPTGAFPDYTVRMVFALPRVRLLSLGSSTWAFTSASAAYKMLNSKNNFGTDPDNSVVYSRGFTMTYDGAGNDLSGNASAIATKLAGADIFVTTYNSNVITTDARNSRITFMNQGGVYVSFFETNASYIRDFARAIIPSASPTNILSTTTGTSGGAYRIDTVDDIITNGPFGDVRNKIWGEDAGGTTSLTGFPASAVTTYSNGVNLKITSGSLGSGSGTGSGTSYYSMLKFENDISYQYSTNNTTTRARWFYCGDGGYLSAATNRDYEDPFLLDINNRPASKAYGYIQTAYAIPGVDTQVGSNYPVYTQNAALFGNIMLWAISQIDYSQKVWVSR